MHIQGIIRTGLRTRLAADTAPVVEIHDAILASEQRRYRAYFNTWRIGAVIAPHYGEQPSSIWKTSLLDVLHPRTVNPYGHLVLGLACNSAGMAADTLSVIDDEAVVHSSEHFPTKDTKGTKKEFPFSFLSCFSRVLLILSWR